MSISAFPISFWFELLSFLISLVVIKKLRSSYFLIFIPFLFLVIFGEYWGTHLKFVNHRHNGWLYNIMNLIQFSFWILLFRENIQHPFFKKMYLFLFFVFFLFGVTNLFFVQGIISFNNYTLIAGSAIVIFQCGVYFYQLLKIEEDINFVRLPMFWIAAGVLIFFIGTFFYFSLYSYLRKIQIQKGTEIFDLIILNLNIVFYSCISIGLVLVEKKNKWKQQL